MVRLLGVELPNEKNVVVALTYIYGIGPSLAKALCEQLSINPQMKSKELNDTQIIALRDSIKEFAVEGDLRKEISMNVKRLAEIGTYRGVRHKKGLPVRGQRTKTNSRTKRGKRMTVGLGKKEEARE
ncbi:MAG: 30S ribosomal protein S13 [bacterium]